MRSALLPLFALPLTALCLERSRPVPRKWIALIAVARLALQLQRHLTNRSTVALRALALVVSAMLANRVLSRATDAEAWRARALALAHALLVRPTMAASSFALRREAQLTSGCVPLPTADAPNDGVIELASMVGVDVPSVRARREGQGVGLRGVRSARQLCELQTIEEAYPINTSFSSGHLPQCASPHDSDDDAHAPQMVASSLGSRLPACRGRWYTLAVHDADHSLGTTLCMRESVGMYTQLVHTLERLQRWP